MLKAFDAPTREECTAQRPASNTPTAAMTLLNDPTFVEAARVFAQSIVPTAKNDSQRLSNAYAAAVSRLPSDSEQVLMLSQLNKWKADYEADKVGAEQLIQIGTKPRDQTIAAPELAAWTNICRAILNLNETVTRN